MAISAVQLLFTSSGRISCKGRLTWRDPVPAERVELSDLVLGPPPAGVIKLGLRHAGLDNAWTERVHPNVSARELASTGLGDRVYPGTNPLSEPSGSGMNADTHAALLALSVRWVSSRATKENQVAYNVQDQLLTGLQQLDEIVSPKWNNSEGRDYSSPEATNTILPPP